MSEGSWNDFDRKPGEAIGPTRDEFDELCATVFTTASGSELIKQLRARTVERRTPRGAPEAQLREDEAQRQLVAALEAARDRGLIAAAKQKSSAT